MDTKPNVEQNEGLLNMFNHFNAELFSGKLPVPYLELTRDKRVLTGFFAPDQWENEEGEKYHVIAINSNMLKNDQDTIELCLTLVHEMVHLEQHVEGTASRRAYHNTAFVKRCKELGLECIDPSTKEPVTCGQSLTDRLILDSPMEAAITDMPDDCMLSYVPVQEYEPEPNVVALVSTANGNGDAEPKRKPGSRTRYTCPLCGLNAWAKHNAKLNCGECAARMVGAA